ncbi:putative pyridoxal phosphate-dependent aminotransferase EpsN [Flavobacteriaceae bacterium UJ101]|nr:putative pyridoxal phosphate-dependent aminotransferase EpsN [Flavobacteriaceae bacterium UJ101]
MKEKIWLSSPHMGGNEFNYMKEAYDTNWIAPLGPNVNGLEHDIENYTNCGYAAALSSGTSAIHLALILSGVTQGDEVLCSSFTFSASVNPIIYQKAIPVFVDSEEDTWNMSPELLKEAIEDRISKGVKPKALILVHLYGMPAKIDEIISICKTYDIVLIEDAAEGLGSTYKGKALGTFGEFGVLSFNGNKIITTSGGGALMSSDENLIKKARFLATQARDEAPHYQHSEIGYNYRMSNICAGIGRGQFEVLDDRVNKKREIFTSYKEKLSEIDTIQFIEEPEGLFSNRWLTTVIIDSEKVTRETVRIALEEDNIESRPLWKPMHLQPVFKKYPAYVNNVSEKLFEKGLCLPSDSKMTESDLNRVVEIIKKLV